VTAGGFPPNSDPAGVNAQRIRVRAKVADGGLHVVQLGRELRLQGMVKRAVSRGRVSLLRNDLKRDASK
jgi:hypothetical protein